MRVNTSILMMPTFTLNLNNARHLNSGFSILELLISVTLLALVMSALYAAFFQISIIHSVQKKWLSINCLLKIVQKLKWKMTEKVPSK